MSTLVNDNPFAAQRLNFASDYRPEWDVFSFNEHASRWIAHQIHLVRSQPAIDPQLRVGALVAAPGVGKTHLFGRVMHALQHDALFVFVPQIVQEQLDRPMQHICWHVIETLFQGQTGGPTRIASTLMRLCAPSFRAYFEGLPPSLAVRLEPLGRRLEEDWTAVQEILAVASDPAPYVRTAEAIAHHFPTSPRDVVRALALGWSPLAAEARCWLRGDSLPDDLLAGLRVSLERPPASQVIKAVAELLQPVQVPVVLFLDQLDAVLGTPEVGPMQLSLALMELLGTVPNLQISFSCLEDRWPLFQEHANAAFLRRIEVMPLQPLSESQAVELVANRLRIWPGRQPDRGETWPLEPDSIKQVARDEFRPSSVLRACAEAFDGWLATGSQGWVRIDGGGPPRRPEELFLEEWNQELSTVQATARLPADVQEAELFQGVVDALEIARQANWLPAGMSLLHSEKQALPKSKNDPRPSLQLRLGVGEQAFGVVVAVTKNEGGIRFGSYMTALERALGGEVVGAVLVRPRDELTVGKRAQARVSYDQWVSAGKLRPFALDSEKMDFEQMQCLLRIQQRAGAGELLLGGQPFGLDQARNLIIRLKLLENLKLLRFVFEGWPVAESARARSGPGDRQAKAAQMAGAASAGAVRSKKAAAGGPAPRDAGEGPGDQAQQPKSPGPDTPGAEAWAQDMLTRVVDKLRAWGQPVTPLGFEIGPTFVRLKVTPQGLTEVNKVRNRAESLQTHLGFPRPVITAQAGYISIDVQRPDRQTISLSDLLPACPPVLKGQPVFPVGVDVSGKAHWLNLSDPSSCHVLIAGTTGSGKSEFMKALLAALAQVLSPDQLQFVLIDPKRVTFNFRGSSPYLPRPVAHEAAEALPLLQEYFEEMEERYALLEKRHKENISELAGQDARPRVVLVFDEFADLMADRGSKKELETLLKRLGAKSRAAGIHLILGTQRTEASVVTPLLRSNLPGRISLQVTGERDSKLILEAPDAAHLLGRGDLFWRQGGGLVRLQSPFVTREELEESLRIV